MTEYEKCMAGEPFDGSSPEIAEMVVRNKRLLQQLRKTDYADNEEKQRIYREMFGSINIGNNVMIAPDVKIFTATHSVHLSERMPERKRPGGSICDTIALPVTIGDGVWIGGNVTILPGITIGHNSVIEAGSVVVRDIPANSIAVGNPCRVIKRIDSDD